MNTIEPELGSVWATGQDSPRAQRRGYTPESVAHPAKMLPAIARHAIAAYTQPGALVFDPMCGIGTTLIEAVRAGRDAMGVEYEPRWAELARENFATVTRRDPAGSVYLGDARDLSACVPATYAGAVDLVVTSPPYGASLHGQVSAVPGQGVAKSGDSYGPKQHDRGNLAHQSLDELGDGLGQIFTGCRRLLKPGGVVAVTARPFRLHGVLVDFPGVVVAAAIRAGLAPLERCVALMAAWRGGVLVARPSFFALDNARKSTAAGRPTAVIVHEDVLVFTNPDTTGEVA